MKMRGVFGIGPLLAALVAGCGGGTDTPANSGLVSAPPPGTVTLQALELAPPAGRLAVGTPLRLQVLGLLGSGGVIDVSDNPQLRWSSSDGAVASVAADGLVTALAAGRVTLGAELYGKTARATFSVTDAPLRHIDITPRAPEIPVGAAQRLAVEGGHADGTRLALDGLVQWASDDPRVARVDERGWLLGGSPGTTRITARLETSPGQWRIGSAWVTVRAASLQSLVVGPADPVLAPGSAQALTASGEFLLDTGGTLLRDLTAQAVWSTDDPAVALVGPLSDGGLELAAGRVLGVTPGTATIGASLAGLAAVTTVEVADLSLQALRLVASDDRPAPGETVELVLLGEYADGSRRDLSDQAIWSSSDATLATVSNAAGRRGRVSVGSSAGTVTVRARFAGLEASQALTVTGDGGRPASLVLAASPDVVLVNGETTRLRVSLLAADGSPVADGSAVTLTVRDVQGALLHSASLATAGGVAGLDFDPATAGLLSVEAGHPASGLTRRITLLASDDPADALSLTGTRAATLSGGSILAGGRFEARLLNASGRDFRVLGQVFCNGAVEAASGTCLGSELSPGLTDTALGEGVRVEASLVLDTDLALDGGLSVLFRLQDVASGRQFPLRLDYF